MLPIMPEFGLKLIVGPRTLTGGRWSFTARIGGRLYNVGAHVAPVATMNEPVSFPAEMEQVR